MQEVKFVHAWNSGPAICLYEMSENYLRAAFLQKSKTKVGDLFKTFTNKGGIYRITEIIKQSDSGARHALNEGVLFELGIEKFNV